MILKLLILSIGVFLTLSLFLFMIFLLIRKKKENKEKIPMSKNKKIIFVSGSTIIIILLFYFIAQYLGLEIFSFSNNSSKKILGKWENQAGYQLDLQENGICSVQGPTTSDSFSISYEDCKWSITDNRIIVKQTIKLSLGTMTQTNTSTLSGLINDTYDTITMDEGAVYTKK